MAELKTKPTTVSPTIFLNAIDDAQLRKDCKALHKMMKDITGKRGKMWGSSMVGFGSYHYRYEPGREGTGLSRTLRRLAMEWPIQ